jgi:nucleotide-binding universal stress UspA family protein
MYRRILVATDGSTLSGKAVSHALQLARTTGAKLTAFYAPPAFPVPVYGDAGLYEAPAKKQYAAVAARDAERVLGPVERKAAQAGVPCDVLQATTDTPWKAILSAAGTEKADVIVMASHGRRGMAALLLGSETTKVLTHSKIPVLVVR